MAWVSEPDKCTHCKSKEPMEFRKVCVDGKEGEGWICDNCGWFHFYDEAYAKKLDSRLNTMQNDINHPA